MIKKSKIIWCGGKKLILSNSKRTKKKKHPKAGCMKGTFIMKDDFDEPLEDFKDYM